jgi:hypothetical protein
MTFLFYQQCLCFMITYSFLLTVLHPRHKLSYFKKAKWENDWIEAARQLVRAEFNRSYRHLSNSQGSALGNKVRCARLLLFRPI